MDECTIFTQHTIEIQTIKSNTIAKFECVVSYTCRLEATLALDCVHRRWAQKTTIIAGLSLPLASAYRMNLRWTLTYLPDKHNINMLSICFL